jgi:hypothetical protein
MTTCLLPFRSPTSIYISGPSFCGKSHLTSRIIQHADTLFTEAPKRIVYAYKCWQSIYEELPARVEMFEGLPSRKDIEEWTTDSQHVLMVIDDQLPEVVSSVDIQELFTVLCHHRNMSVILLGQNIFTPGKCSRTISLNCHYLILFKNHRDKQQISTLASQIYPGAERAYFLDAFRRAVQNKYGYLVCDLHPASSDDYRLRTDIIPGQETVTVYRPK